jgi:hypothetical protein
MAALPVSRTDDDLAPASVTTNSTSFNTSGPSALSVMLERNSRPSSGSTSRVESPRGALRELATDREAIKVEGPSEGRSSPARSYEDGFAEKDGEGGPDISGSSDQGRQGSSISTTEINTRDDSPDIITPQLFKSPIPTPASGSIPASPNPTERTPLISIRKPTGEEVSYTKGPTPVESGVQESSANFLQHARTSLVETLKSVKKASAKDAVDVVVMQPLQAIPAVILGLLLNVLDGVSYGMIL